MALEKEVATYHRELPSLFKDAGKFVLIHEDTVIDVFDTYEDALKAGYEKVGVAPFLVRRIEHTGAVHHITRDVRVACLT